MKRTITATQLVHASQERCRAVLLDHPGTVLGDAPTAEDHRRRRFRSKLSVEIGSGASVAQEVDVRLDAPRPDAPAGTVVLPLRWQATDRPALFPTFDGELTASPDRRGSRLTLRGRYTLPFGVLGRYADHRTGHHVAERSLTSFLSEIARRLDSEVVPRLDASPFCPAARPDPLHDRRSCFSSGLGPADGGPGSARRPLAVGSADATDDAGPRLSAQSHQDADRSAS